MNAQEYFKKTVKEARDKTLLESDQLTLGKIISKLKPIVAKQESRANDDSEEAVVFYDFGYFSPTCIDSWRGSYDELALDYVEEENQMPVTDFYNMLKETIGKTFTGYKGGNFTMGESTPVWVANYGNSGDTAVVNIVDNDYTVIIITGFREF